MTKVHLRGNEELPHCRNPAATAANNYTLTDDYLEVTCNKCKQRTKYKELIPTDVVKKESILKEKDPYNLNNIDMSEINKTPFKHSDADIGAAKWLLSRGLPVSRTKALIRISADILTSVRKGESFSKVPECFPVQLITVDDIEAVERTLKKLRIDKLLKRNS